MSMQLIAALYMADRAHTIKTVAGSSSFCNDNSVQVRNGGGTLLVSWEGRGGAGNMPLPYWPAREPGVGQDVKSNSL